MAHSIDLQQLEKESRRLFSEDGLLYFYLGFLLLLIGAAFAVPSLAAFVGFGAFLMFPLEALRRRWTYPRLGYARFSPPPGALRGILVFAALTAVSLVALAFTADGRFQPYLPLAFGLVFALTLYFGQSAHGLRLLDWLLILLALSAGLFTTWYYADWRDGAAVLFAILGVASLLVGLVTLVHFLRTYPRLESADPS